MVSVPHGLSVTRPLCPQGFMPVNTATHARSMATTPRAIWLIGPALGAGIAYLDPGNVGSNMTAGSTHGFLLVWVVILGNAMAWLIQYLSAKLGIVTGQSLPEVLGGRLYRRPWLRRSYWLQAELVAMATDIAEVIGGAVALHLLFGVPLVWGGVTAGVASIPLLFVQSRYGARLFEVIIIGLIVIIAVGFTVGVFIAPPSLGSVVGGLVPRVTDTSSVLLAASILGATIMPHAIYAHSALSRDRFAPPTTAKGVDASSGLTPGIAHEPGTATILSTERLVRITRIDVAVAMAIAGSVNLALLLLAATTLSAVPGTDDLEGAYRAIGAVLGPVVATLFAVGLLASGLASTAVGAYAGAEIMQGLLRIRVPLLLRRTVTLLPALGILGVGLDPTQALVLSQVVLSFGIPFALVPLVALTANRALLGQWRNTALTTAAGIVASVFITGLNTVLLWLFFTGGQDSPAHVGLAHGKKRQWGELAPRHGGRSRARGSSIPRSCRAASGLGGIRHTVPRAHEQLDVYRARPVCPAGGIGPYRAGRTNLDFCAGNRRLSFPATSGWPGICHRPGRSYYRVARCRIRHDRNRPGFCCCGRNAQLLV